jgi:putative ABC transport system substrate-binding protein
MPVVGVLDSGSADTNEQYLAPFWQSPSEAGFVEGQNVAAEYRSADGSYDLLPELAADLVRRRLSLIAVPSSTPAALAAKAATSTIPIVFGVGDDPVKLGCRPRPPSRQTPAAGIGIQVANRLGHNLPCAVPHCVERVVQGLRYAYLPFYMTRRSANLGLGKARVSDKLAFV